MPELRSITAYAKSFYTFIELVLAGGEWRRE